MANIIRRFDHIYSNDLGTMRMADLKDCFEKGVIKRFHADRYRLLSPDVAERFAKNNPFNTYTVAECTDGNTYLLDGYKRLEYARRNDTLDNDSAIIHVKWDVSLNDMLAIMSANKDVLNTVGGFVNSVCNAAVFKEPPEKIEPRTYAECRTSALQMLCSAAHIRCSPLETGDYIDFISDTPLEPVISKAAGIYCTIADTLTGLSPKLYETASKPDYIKLLGDAVTYNNMTSVELKALLEWLQANNYLELVAGENGSAFLLKLILDARPWTVSQQELKRFKHDHAYKGYEAEINGALQRVPYDSIGDAEASILVALKHDRDLTKHIIGILSSTN